MLHISPKKKQSSWHKKTQFCCPRTRKERQLEDLGNLMLKRIDATPGVFFLHNAKTHFGRRTNNIQWNMFIVAANDRGSRHPLSSTANGPSPLFLFGGIGFQSLSRTSLRVALARKVIRSAVKHYLCRKAIKAVNLTSGNSNNSHLKCLRRSVSFVVNLCCETKAGRRVKK